MTADLRKDLAARLHAALGSGDWGTANGDERTEMLDAADALLAAPDLVIPTSAPTDADLERGAKVLWMAENRGNEDWAEMAWAEMTSPDDWSQYAFDLAEAVRAVLTSPAGTRP